MNEPSLFTFANGKLVPQGNAKIEMQTPDEFIASSPLQEIEDHHWGDSVVRILTMADTDDNNEPVTLFYAIVERLKEDGRGMEPKWAIIVLTESNLPDFREKLKYYFERTP